MSAGNAPRCGTGKSTTRSYGMRKQTCDSGAIAMNSKPPLSRRSVPKQASTWAGCPPSYTHNTSSSTLTRSRSSPTCCRVASVATTRSSRRDASVSRSCDTDSSAARRNRSLATRIKWFVPAPGGSEKVTDRLAVAISKCRPPFCSENFHTTPIAAARSTTAEPSDGFQARNTSLAVNPMWRIGLPNASSIFAEVGPNTRSSSNPTPSAANPRTQARNCSSSKAPVSDA